MAYYPTLDRVAEPISFAGLLEQTGEDGLRTTLGPIQDASWPPVRIERVEVEEGFLTGLDLFFRPGLNVLIGPRGSGKTSIIELLRFCLEVSELSDSSKHIAREHAMSVLGSGVVTVHLRIGDEVIVFSRSATDARPRASMAGISPHVVVLSQNEIEAVGLDAKGRLNLIDRFRAAQGAEANRESALLSDIASLTTELTSLAQEIQDLTETLSELAAVQAQLKEAEAQQDKYLANHHEDQDGQGTPR